MVYATPVSLNIKDGAGASKNLLTFSNGTQQAYGMSLVDNLGNLITDALPLQIRTCPLIVAGSTITRVADANAYVAGDFIANSVTAASCTISNSGFTIACARGADLPGRLVGCILRGSGTATASRQFGIHAFNANPLASAPANGDNGALTPSGSGSNYLGSFYSVMRRGFGSGSVGIGTPLDGSYINFTPASGTSNLFFLLTAEAGYTQVNGETFDLTTITE